MIGYQCDIVLKCSWSAQFYINVAMFPYKAIIDCNNLTSHLWNLNMKVRILLFLNFLARVELPTGGEHFYNGSDHFSLA